MKEIIGKIKFGVVGIPSDVTWFSLTDNFMGEFVNKSLNLKGGKFLQYGKIGSTYYNPETFYCVEKYSNPILVGKLSEITEEQAAEFVENIYGAFELGEPSYKEYGEISWSTYPYLSAKESLISLLKANDCLTKEMAKNERHFNACMFDEQGQISSTTPVILRWKENKEKIEKDYPIKFEEVEFKNIEDYPDDFLIIKL